MPTCTKCRTTKPVSEFYRQNGRPRSICAACFRAYAAAKYRRDQGYYKDWYAKNREKKRAASREYQRRTGYRGRRADWWKAALRTGQCNAEQLEWKITYYGRKCAYCGGPYETIDHVIPLSRGGTSHPANLVPACRTCNFSKHAKTLKEWATGVIPYHPRAR